MDDNNSIRQLTDGRIIVATKDGFFEYKDGQLVKPTFDFSLDDFTNGQPVDL